MPASIDIMKFMGMGIEHPILDVRTPAEFEQGHIYGAINFPLFDNEERVIIGTLYKQEGREKAIIRGLDLVRPKIGLFVERAKELNKTGTYLVHCWRGGMRSGSLSWLLEMYGFKVYTLKGGYKSFRKFVLNSFIVPRSVTVLGGNTGSGKTAVLDELKKRNEQVIDLEKLASHKGSSFGSLGEEKQPTQEQFENDLAAELHSCNPQKKIWIEDESRMIGKKVIPGGLWEQMRAANVLFLDIPFKERTAYLTKEYGKYNKADLKNAIERITKRLGPEQTKLALESLENKDISTVCEICLHYYDKAYQHGINKRDKRKITTISFNEINPLHITQKIINEWKK